MQRLFIAAKLYCRDLARVVVPKLVRSGHNSSFGLVACLMSPFKVYASVPGLNAEGRLLTIFNHFRNRHARYDKVR